MKQREWDKIYEELIANKKTKAQIETRKQNWEKKMKNAEKKKEKAKIKAQKKDGPSRDGFTCESILDDPFNSFIDIPKHYGSKYILNDKTKDGLGYLVFYYRKDGNDFIIKTAITEEGEKNLKKENQIYSRMRNERRFGILGNNFPESVFVENCVPDENGFLESQWVVSKYFGESFNSVHYDLKKDSFGRKINVNKDEINEKEDNKHKMTVEEEERKSNKALVNRFKEYENIANAFILLDYQDLSFCNLNVLDIVINKNKEVRFLNINDFAMEDIRNPFFECLNIKENKEFVAPETYYNNNQNEEEGSYQV